MGSLNEGLYRTICCNPAPEFSAHVTGLRLDANPLEIESVCVAACANGWIIAQFAVSVPFAGVIQQLELLIPELEKRTTQTSGIGRSPGPMTLIPAIVLAPGIVEDCEEAHHMLDGAAALRDKHAIPLDSAPM